MARICVHLYSSVGDHHPALYKDPAAGAPPGRRHSSGRKGVLFLAFGKVLVICAMIQTITAILAVIISVW